MAYHRLAAVPFTDVGATEPLGILYRRKKKLTPAMHTFIQELKETHSATMACWTAKTPGRKGFNRRFRR